MTSKEREAMTLALEALESGKPMFDAYWGGSKFDQAITAIKEALSSPNGEEQPEKRTWVGLTDEEAKSVNFPNPGVCYVYPSDWEEVGLPFVRAIEAKLKEKNT